MGLAMLQEYFGWPGVRSPHVADAAAVKTETSGPRLILGPGRTQKDSIQQVVGDLVRIQPVQLFELGLSPGVALILKSNRDAVVVYVGSEFSFTLEDIGLEAGDRIRVLGVPTMIGGVEFLIPSEIQTSTRRHIIMDKEQLLLWVELIDSLPQNSLWAQQIY